MPSLKLGNNNVTTVKIGSTQVNKVYLGSTEIWSSWSPQDADAITYINTMNALPGVTLTLTEKQAIDNMFLRIKGLDPAFGNYGNTEMWDRRVALYPYLGSNMEAFRYNAFVPVTTNSTDGSGNPNGPGYQTFYGGGSYDSYGHVGNGINAYSNTNLNHTNGYLASKQQVNQGLTMGTVYKNTESTIRCDFGVYSTFFPNDATMYLTTRPVQGAVARIFSYDHNVTGMAIPGGKGHWMIVKNDSVGIRKAYYQGAELTLSANQNRTQVPTQGYFFSYPANAMNFNGNYQNFLPAGQTTMLFYIFLGFTNTTIINAWNQIVEAFCAETGKKTW
jgi:hypothetical protein